MFSAVSDVFMDFFGRVIILISTAPVCYLFYTILFCWVIHLFFRIVRS